MAAPQVDPSPRHRAWRVLVPVTALAAGLLFATSARADHSTELRGSSASPLADLVRERQREVAAQERDASRLRGTVADLSAQAATGNGQVAAARDRAATVGRLAGADPVTGPGLTVSLDDATRLPGGGVRSTNPDDLVVHQQDVQSVVNGLWAGGAEAMTIMGERIVSTTAVRCVGNTLLLHGRLYGPPFVVAAVGDTSRLRDALDQEPGIVLLEQYVAAFDLRFSVSSGTLHLPGYDGTLDLPHTTVPGASTP